ncbi:hypothetical protein NEOKW01_0111 [Nematocida sp. AWRm80]|nr:hypothetical protein NEOKW01_0111 [Nematocida sp. AWRm80]
MKIQDLCEKGFYGVLSGSLSEEDLKDALELIEKGEAIGVTKQSVLDVQATHDINMFVEVSNITNSTYIRATTKEFEKYVSKGRGKLMMTAYYFFIHELLMSPNNTIEGISDLSKKYNWDSKVSSYLLKKLVQWNRITRNNKTIKLVDFNDNTEIPSVIKLSKSLPKCYYKHVSMFEQIYTLAHESKVGISSGLLQDTMGLLPRQSLEMIRMVTEISPEEFIKVTVFEGRIRRVKYILARHYQQREKVLLDNVSKHSGNDIIETGIDTSIRDKLLEELVIKTGALTLSRNLCCYLPKLFNTRFQMCMKTIEKMAKNSEKIRMFEIHALSPHRKLITKTVLSDASLEQDDPKIIAALKNEIKDFTMVINGEVKEYYSTEITYHEEIPVDKEQSLLRIKKNFPGLRYKEFPETLINKYNSLYASVQYGYLLNRKERLNALMNYWKSTKAKVSTIALKALAEIPLTMIFTIVNISSPEIIQQLDEFYQEKNKDWRELKYKDFKISAPYSLANKVSQRIISTYVLEYISEMSDLGWIEKISDKSDEFTISEDAVPLEIPPEESTHLPNDQSTYTKDSSESIRETYPLYVPLAIRQKLCSTLQEQYDIRIVDSVKIDSETEDRLLLDLAFNEIKRAPVSVASKREMVLLFKKSTMYRYRWNQLFEYVTFQSFTSQPITLIKKEFTTEDILRVTLGIKEYLYKNDKIYLLTDLIEEDYFLLECVILTLESMGVLLISKLNLACNSLAISPMNISGAYKRSFVSSIEYSNTFQFGIPEDKYKGESPALYSSVLALFKYLLHNGSTTISVLLGKPVYLLFCEIEYIQKEYPEVFSLITEGTPEEWILTLRYLK